MSENEAATGPSPGVDALAGLFFLLWGVVGWASYLSNDRLHESLGQSVDPGPALMPLIVLSLLTAGGATILAKGVLRWRSAQAGEHMADVPPARDHLRPAFFALSVLVAVAAMETVGFVAAAFVFCLVWLYGLRNGAALSLRGALSALALAAFLAIAVHLVFARFLLVPLP